MSFRVGQLDTNMKSKKRLILTLNEYRLILAVMDAVRSALGEDQTRACLFYNTIGAFILERSFGISARPMIGAAFFRVHDHTDSVLSYAEIDEATGQMTSSKNGFHCWVETAEHLIDFTAPRYREAMLEIGHNLPIPRKMFQRQKSTAVSDISELRREGDFLVVPDQELALSLLRNATKTHALGDLAEICVAWINKPPKKTPETFHMQDDLGAVFKMQLRKINLVGAW
jgi:hypothetical protein